MPVDTTRVISTRRTQKQISEEELKDIELKRLRGILSAGQGTRFILADTDQLHRKITEMSNRIRQLEDALAILQASISDERHPLLSDDHLRVKFGSESLNPKMDVVEEDSNQAIDALGTLTLGESGEMKYFGRSAGSETLMMAEDAVEGDESGQEGEELPPLSPEIENLENMAPLLSVREPCLQSIARLESFLPDPEKAAHLADVYINHGTFFFRPVKRDELFDSLIPDVYKAAALNLAGDGSARGESLDSNAPHVMATLFFIFALGALLDVKLAPYNATAEHYYHLGKAALSLRPVCGSPSLETVQAVGLMATYHNLAGKKYSRDSAWCIMSLAAKLAQSFGLHRDSARWNLDAKTVQKRRNIFWEVFASDVSHSLALGRPPAIHLSYVDCEFPDDEEAITTESGDKQSGFWALKHNYAKHIFYSVAETTLTAQPPSYETVLEIDRKVREMSFQSASRPYATQEDGADVYHSSSLSLKDFYVSQYRTVTMIYLHRSFFAQAVLDHPANPLLSSFAPSFLTAYRCASIVIKASVHQFDRCASMAKRIWFLLYHTFSAAVIVGTIVTRSPKSSMAANAFKDLNVAVELFEQAADQSQRAKVALAVLRRLQEKAQRSFKAVEGGEAPTVELKVVTATPDGDSDDELAIFGGQVRVVTKKVKPPRSESSVSPKRGPGELKNKDSRGRSMKNGRGGPRSPAGGSDSTNPRSSNIPGAISGFSGSPLFNQTFLTGGHTVPQQHISSIYGLPPHFYQASSSSAPQTSSVRSTANTWSTSWDFGSGDFFSEPLPPSNACWSQTGPANNLGETATNAPHSFEFGFTHSNPDVNHRKFLGGSDASTSHYPQSSQYDVQENAGLFSSIFGDGSSKADGHRWPAMHTAGVHQGTMGPSPYPHMNPGAVELGLSGESRLDAGWIAFMKDCGILGMDVDPYPSSTGR
ncbi:hypothetical protein FA15DRAFT_704519 [Coprinopsis marcescibilis]|uniref:Xylanolytic transcriptional activator regulatory domain-containing protein n=1 Tax=Coprinopsis marcescibilis TaxID=230819 RepID=A0A5C3KVH0_COPMA|nr:hypothetical protein FA15DRAFT_704519 [Coprinopsis marcescibilis]